MGLGLNVQVAQALRSSEPQTLAAISAKAGSSVDAVQPLLEQLCLSGLVRWDGSAGAERFWLSKPEIGDNHIAWELGDDKRWVEVDGKWIRGYRLDSAWVAECNEVPGILARGFDKAEAVERAVAFAKRMSSIG